MDGAFAVAHKRAEVISHISLSQDGVGHVAERTGGGCRESNTHRQEIQYDNATRVPQAPKPFALKCFRLVDTPGASPFCTTMGEASGV